MDVLENDFNGAIDDRDDARNERDEATATYQSLIMENIRLLGRKRHYKGFVNQLKR